MKKKMIAIMLAVALVAVGLASFVHAEDPVNQVFIGFGRHYDYNVLVDDFTNQEVIGGEKGWYTGLQNWEDTSGESVNGVTLTLDLDPVQELDYMDPDPDSTDPLTWSFGTVDEGFDAGAGVGSGSVNYWPGFDAHRHIVDDKTVFLQSEGENQIQIVDIEVTPQVEWPNMFDIHVEVPDSPLVNTVIDSVYNISEGVVASLDDRHVHIAVEDPGFGNTFTATVQFRVTPNVPEVEFIPYVQIGRTPFTEIYCATVRPIDLETEIGTWTWDAVGNYEWFAPVEEVTSRGLTWQPSVREMVNMAEVQYSTFRIYTAPGNTFENGEVTGDIWWHTELWNAPDASEEPIAGPELSLDTGLALDWYPFGSSPTLVTEGPPTYVWGFAELSEGESGTVFVHPTNPADEVLGSFTPGFNASVSVDKTEFSGPDTQTLTITVEKVDPEAHITLLVFTDESLIPLVPVDEDDLVEAVIPSSYEFPEWTDFVFPGGTGFVMDTMHMEPDEIRIIEIPIEVTPKVPRVEYKPAVNVGSKDLYPEHTGPFGSFHSFEVDSLGTWTWSAEGEYDWRWEHREGGGQVVFPGISSPIENFAITEMVVEFDQRPNHDKIDIKKATFRIQEGATCDLAVDDVTVNADGVVTTIPAGSFVQGRGGDYIFKTPRGVEPKVDMKLNFDKGEWSFKIDKTDASIVDNLDGVDVTFSIGFMGASEHIDMWIDRLSYKAGP